MELFILWIVMAAICAMIAHSKGRSGVGFFFYGLLIWPIALVHALLSARREPSLRDHVEAGRFPCPFCAEYTKRAAQVCPHCHRDLPEDWASEALAEMSPAQRRELGLREEK